MPKHFITGQDFGRSATVEGADGKSERVPMDSNQSVKVGWSREPGHVELAVVNCVDGTYVENGYLTGPGPRTTEEQIADALSTPLYVQMDRRGLNELILTLRKARDAAFGKDA